MRIVYVAQYFMLDGLKLGGRSLVRHLAAEHDVRVCGAIVADDSPLLGGDLADDIVSASDLDTADVVYMEGGWNHQTDPEDRIPLAVATSFVRRGGQLIVADVSRNVAQLESAALAAAQPLLRAVPSHDERGLRYLHDEGARGPKNTQRFFASQLRVSDWLIPAWVGIDSILTWGAIELNPGDGILASGHSSTRVLVDDLFVDGGWHWPWASVNGFGSGHVAVLGADMSWDYLVEECPDNARWLSNVMTLLSDRSHESVAWRTPRRASQLQQGREGAARLLEVEESQSHERKSSFLAPMDPQRQNVPQKVLQEQVGKSIAAMANTDGGNVVIGQADEGTVLGLEADFRSLNKHQGRDGFEQALVQYIANNMKPSWEYLGLQLSWAEQESKTVAIVHVPRCATPVHLDYQQHKEAVFVRRGTRTDRLEGRALTEWLTGPRFKG